MNEPAIQSPSPYSILAAAVKDPACDPAKMRELLNVMRDYNSDEARKAYNRAMVKFQSECPPVQKIDENGGTRSKYAKMERIMQAVLPVMMRNGLGVFWESAREESGKAIMDGTIRHSDGHSEKIHFEMPMPEPVRRSDGKPVQNAAQTMGVAMTYCERRGTCSCLGIRLIDDTDASLPARATTSSVVKLRELIASTGKSEADALRYLQVESLEDADGNKIAQLTSTLEKMVSKK